MNPYLNKGMITDPIEFYGREEEIANIYERIKTTQSIYIVGERGIGKSSLLDLLLIKCYLRPKAFNRI
jgi:ABC-type phosphate/phosphonate transport system ATPase subunit